MRGPTRPAKRRTARYRCSVTLNATSANPAPRDHQSSRESQASRQAISEPQPTPEWATDRNGPGGAHIGGPSRNPRRTQSPGLVRAGGREAGPFLPDPEPGRRVAWPLAAPATQARPNPTAPQERSWRPIPRRTLSLPPPPMTPYAIAVAIFAAFVVGGVLGKAVPLRVVVCCRSRGRSRRVRLWRPLPAPVRAWMDTTGLTLFRPRSDAIRRPLSDAA